MEGLSSETPLPVVTKLTPTFILRSVAVADNSRHGPVTVVISPDEDQLWRRREIPLLAILHDEEVVPCDLQRPIILQNIDLH